MGPLAANGGPFVAAIIVQGGPSTATNIATDGPGGPLAVRDRQSMKLLLILLLSWIPVFNVTPLLMYSFSLEMYGTPLRTKFSS